MQNKNYNLLMEETMRTLPPGTPLLLHVCCAPCASAVLERLSSHFTVFLYYYNPNIQPVEEHRHRWEEIERLVSLLQPAFPITLLEGPYNTEAFLEAAKGLESEPEGGRRCDTCFALRLEQSAREAKKREIEWFTTTLSISPHKNAPLLNSIGEEMGNKWGVHHLPADFKKKEGYKRSIELSKAFDLYRQDYCGCLFSKALL